MKRMVAAVALMVLVVAACGGGSDNGDDSVAADGDDFCALFQEAGGDPLGGVDVGEAEVDVAEVERALDQLVEQAPDEVQADLELLRDAFLPVAEALDGIDPDNPEDFQAALGVLAQFEDRADELDAAGARVEQWARENCDLPDDFFDVGSATSSEPEELATGDSDETEAGDDNEAGDDTEIGDGPADGEAINYGDDPALDELYDSCDAGDYAACDSLYGLAPEISEYRSFGGRCGLDVEGFFGNGDCVATVGALEDVQSEGAMAYGDDPTLDELHDNCGGGDMVSCDTLYFTSPFGSEYEAFGETCGGTSGASPGACSSPDERGGPEADVLGDHAGYDALYVACEDSVFDACDDLYLSSEIDSTYEQFGSTCGGRSDQTFGACTDELGGDAGLDFDSVNVGDDPGLDTLYSACEEVAGQACDLLFEVSPFDSEYEAFSLTCGGRRSEDVAACPSA